MLSDSINNLIAFRVVAEERSFTRAAARLGLSQSRLSQTIRILEERLGIRLLSRTTRSVALTTAGEQLLAELVPALDQIEHSLLRLGGLRDRPAGSIRITADEHAVKTILWPALLPVLKEYPEIKIEITADYGLSDIVAERYDAGVRYGDQVEKNMIAVRIGPDTRLACVASPSYFADRSIPQTPHELTAHECINLRYIASGGLYVWEFERDGRPVNVRVRGQLIFNSVNPILEATLAGFGLAYLPYEQVRPCIEAGQLIHVLEAWSAPFQGYHLYYPSRRADSPAFSIVLDALRYRT